MYACAVRSAAPTRDSWAVPFRAKSHVHRRRNRPCRRGAFLPIIVDLDLRWLVFLAIHLFVVSYEEPTLRQTFGSEYEEYCREVRRWWPKRKLKEEGRMTNCGS